MFIFIQNLINKTLETDPKAASLLTSLSDKTIEIHISTLNKSFFLTFPNNKLKISQQADSNNPINASIKGPVMAFLKLVLNKNPQAAARLGLTLEGETETLQTLQPLLLDLNIDWEELLSHWTGDIVGHQIGNLARSAQQKRKSFIKSTSHMITEYLQEETKLLPTRYEIDQFMNEVDELRAGTDRLEARIDLLLFAANPTSPLNQDPKENF